MTGEGIVVAARDQAEIDRLTAAFEADFQPQSPLGSVMVRKMAVVAVRSERCSEGELAAVAGRVRNAVDAFDEARFEKADALLDDIHENPRGNLRKLKKMPEGVDRLLDAWGDLRDGLTREGRGSWTAAHLELAAHLTGVRSEAARTTRLGELSDAVWGDFGGLADHEGAGLKDEARRKYARGRIVERIDVEIEALKAHRETLDLATIEQDRVEAPARALFDPSPDATRARRYEADADRRFFKCLKELRRAEADYAERCALDQAHAAPSEPAAPEPTLGSFCEVTPSPDGRRRMGLLDLPSVEDSVVRDADGKPLWLTWPPQPPR